MVLASESNIDPVSLAAISRKLNTPIKTILAQHGEVTVGLRHWYTNMEGDDPRKLLDEAVQSGQISQTESKNIWNFYVSRQFLFAEILMSLGRIDATALNALLLQHESSPDNLGKFLVDNKIVSEATLNEALDLQKQLQPDMAELLAKRA